MERTNASTNAILGESSLPQLNSRQNDWVLVEEGDMKGANIIVHNETNEVVQLSTRESKDEDRWTTMPSLEAYPSLQLVDLDNSRYITELHDSITGLSNMKKLMLTRCVSLERLPASLGRLESLQEVGKLVPVPLIWQNLV